MKETEHLNVLTYSWKLVHCSRQKINYSYRSLNPGFWKWEDVTFCFLVNFMFYWPCILIQSCKKTNLMHNLFLVYFVNIYMFRAYLGPSSGGTTVCIQQLVLIILFRWLSAVLDELEQSNQDNSSHLKRIISTNCCIHTVVTPDDGPRYARNM